MTNQVKDIATGNELVEKKGKAKDRIMDAAVKCLSESGLGKANMDEVASIAGVSRSTLYRHFKDRDELILAVVERESMQIGLDIQNKIQASEDLGEYIVEGILLAEEKRRKGFLLNGV